MCSPLGKSRGLWLQNALAGRQRRKVLELKQKPDSHSTQFRASRSPDRETPTHTRLPSERPGTQITSGGPWGGDAN